MGEQPQKNEESSRTSRIEGWAKTISIAAALIAALTVLLTNLGQLQNAICNTLRIACSESKNQTGSETPTIPRRFVHVTGSFERAGNEWIEYPAHQYGHFKYETGGAAGGYVFLVDKSRLDKNDPNRPFFIRMPLNGGMSQWSFPNPYIWQDLYVVRPER